jgi:hypothetical protein
MFAWLWKKLFYFYSHSYFKLLCIASLDFKSLQNKPLCYYVFRQLFLFFLFMFIQLVTTLIKWIMDAHLVVYKLAWLSFFCNWTCNYRYLCCPLNVFEAYISFSFLHLLLHVCSMVMKIYACDFIPWWLLIAINVTKEDLDFFSPIHFKEKLTYNEFFNK